MSKSNIPDNELEVIQHLIKNASILSEKTRRKFFRHFRVLLNSDQRYTLGVDCPSINNLEPGKCNIPWQLTKRSQLYHKPYPCKCLENARHSRRYFCHFHEDFAIQNGLPIEAPQLTLTQKKKVRKRKLSTVVDSHDDYSILDQSKRSKKPQCQISEYDCQLDTTLSSPYVDIDYMGIDAGDHTDAIPCEYVLGCDGSSHFDGFCEHHQQLSAHIDAWSDDPDAMQIVKYEVAIQRIRDELNNTDHNDDGRTFNQSKSNVLERLCNDDVINLLHHIRLKHERLQKCHLVWLISIRNRMARAIGIGRPQWYDDYVSLQLVPQLIASCYFEMNNQVKL